MKNKFFLFVFINLSTFFLFSSQPTYVFAASNCGIASNLCPGAITCPNGNNCVNYTYQHEGAGGLSCTYGGTCVAGPGNGTCIKTGTNGKPEADPSKCKNGYVCVATGNSFSCVLPAKIKPGSQNASCNPCKSSSSQCNSGLTCIAIVSGTCNVNAGTCTKVIDTPTGTLPPPPSPPCETWVNGQCTNFYSALGSLSTNPAGFIQSIFAVLLSVSGGIALLLIIRAGYQLMTSQGKPEQMQQGRDQLIAAIVGLVFLIFSFVFLQLIGYDILHIPGFGNGNGGGNGTGNNVPVCAPGSCIPRQQACGGNTGTLCNTNGCPAGEACTQ